MRWLIAAVALLACERPQAIGQQCRAFESDEASVMSAAVAWIANSRHQQKPWLVSCSNAAARNGS
jgi:hypothetical protein